MESIVFLRKLLSISSLIFALFVLSITLRCVRVSAQQVFAAPSGYSACAIDANGNLYTWGCDNYNHTVVSARAPQDLTPVEVALPAGVSSWETASPGAYYTIALGSDGNIFAWGYNANGELGDSSTANSPTPVKVVLPAGVTSWTAIAAGDSFNLAVGNDGNLYAWGANSQGQLGDDTTMESTVPVKVDLPSGVTATKIAAGEQFAAVIGSDGKIYVWGTNDNGQLGTGSSTPARSSVPLPVSLPNGITPVAISTGRSFCLVIGNDGNIYGWGGNSSGQLNNSATFGKLDYTPVVAAKPSGVTSWRKAVGGGEGFSLGIGSDGKLYAWGYNGLGELGIGSTAATNAANDSAQAVVLPPGETVLTMAASDYSDYAIAGEGDTLYAWGYNQQGEIGKNTTTTDQLLPTKVLGVGGVGYLTLSSAPSAPSLVSPNDITGVPRSATLIWNSVHGATTYELQVATGIHFYFSSIVADTTLQDTTVTLSSPLASVTKYYWRVVATGSNFTSPYSAVDSFTTGTGITAIQFANETARRFALFQNYPNPFNPTTVIRYDLPKSEFVSLSVFNVLGQRVATLVDAPKASGDYQVYFSANGLASGTYFYTLQQGHNVITRKMVLLR